MISLKVIMPKELWFSPGRLEKAINKALDSAALGAKADFEATIATWEHKPSFQITKDGFKRIVFTKSEIYKDLNDGTKERHVIMTPGLQAKTIPHKLTSRVGKGGVLAFTKRPMPGIDGCSQDSPQAIGASAPAACLDPRGKDGGYPRSCSPYTTSANHPHDFSARQTRCAV